MKLYVFASNISVYAWQFNMIERLIAQQNIDQVFLVSTSKTIELDNTFPKTTPFLISLLYKIDSVLSKCDLNTLGPEALSDLPASKNIIKERGELSINRLTLDEYFTKIKSASTSSALVLNTSENNLDDEIISITPINIYSVFLGSDKRVISPLTGVLEFMAGKKAITSGIQIEKTREEKNRVIFSSTTSVESPSLCRTIETCLNKTSVFLARTIHNVNTTPELFELIDYPEPESKLVNQSIPLHKNITLLFHFTARIVKRAFDKFTVTEQWILLLGKNEASNLPNHAISSYSKIIPPKDEFWADPFIVEYSNKHYLFFEVFPYKRDLGHLSCMEIHNDGSYTEPVMILERPYHLSYPNVFEYENEFYMIPESGDNGTIELYKAKAFPYEWEFVHNMMDNISAYDSTLHSHDGLWWLFATVAETKLCPTTEELYLFYADSPISDNWIAHANNPVVSDAASARPAGKLFQKNNKIIRPSQNCAGSYGAGLNLCEVITLNKNTYKEKIIESFSPNWDPKLSGLHTLNFNEKFSVSDAILKRGRRL